MRKINLTDGIQTNYFGIKKAFRDYLIANKLDVHVDEDEERAIIYDHDGNDLAHMTLKQLEKRVKL